MGDKQTLVRVFCRVDYEQSLIFLSLSSEKTACRVFFEAVNIKMFSLLVQTKNVIKVEETGGNGA